MEQDAEYQKAYDAEIARLDGEAASEAITPQAEVVVEEVAPIVEETPQEAEPDATTLAKQLESTNKALQDTQRWGHENAKELKALKKQLEEQERAKNRPEILDAFDGLEEAIKYTARVESKPEEDKSNKWLSTVETVIPEIEKLLNIPEFQQAAIKVRDQMGEAWNDPLAASRELGNLRNSYNQYQAATAAKQAAVKDFEARAKKTVAMSVPGGSGSSAPAKADAVSEVWGMSDEEFNKQRAKVLGY